MISYPESPYVEVADYLVAALQNRGIAVVRGEIPCPKFWIALGSQAAERIRAQDSTTPMLIGLVLNAATIDRLAPASGVFLQHPMPVQWQAWSHLFPNVSHLGVLYDPRYLPLLNELKQLARAAGVRVTALPVTQPADLASALKQLPQDVEAIWPIGNGTVFSLISARPLFLHAQYQRLPLVGLSARWVEAGAAYALDWDWPKIAEQLADIGQTLEQTGTLPAPQPPCCPKLVTHWQMQNKLSKKMP
jgi:putative ABC transport system substrate-binding protein